MTNLLLVAVVSIYIYLHGSSLGFTGGVRVVCLGRITVPISQNSPLVPKTCIIIIMLT